MAASSTRDSVSACSSLATRARSGAQEIESLLSGRVDAPELQQLRSLATKLHQLSRNATDLESELKHHGGGEQTAAPELAQVLSDDLAACNDAAGIVAKQLMRLGPNTPREAISVTAVVLYESYADAATRFLEFITPLLAKPVEVRTADIQSDDARLVLSDLTTACEEATRSSGILLNYNAARRARYEATLGDKSDAAPPGYEPYGDAPPPFEDGSAFVKADPPLPTNGAGGSSSNNSSFLSSLASPFKAATAALRTKPEPLVNALCQAAATGNTSQILSLLAEGANINGRGDDGHTALISAVRAGQLEVIQTLLSSGADTSRTSSGSIGGKGGPSPLFHAIETQNRPAAELLLKHGADPNQKNGWGERFFLSLVTGETSPEWLSLLLTYGADASAKDASGQAPVILAMRRRKRKEDREDVVRLLLRHGAEVDSRDTDGTPLIHLCLQQKRRGLALELLSLGADPNGRDVSGITLLETVVKNDDLDPDLELTRAVLLKGADPNVKDFYGYNLLLSVLPAGTERKRALAVTLLEHGARGDVKDFYGVSALEHALSPVIQGKAAGGADGDKLRIPELLLKQGADPNQTLTKVPGEPTVLVYAIERRVLDLVVLVLRYGAAVNMVVDKDKEKEGGGGTTPLVLAVQKGDVGLVDLLLRHGANVDMPGPLLPLEVASGLGNEKVVELLRRNGAAAGA